MKKGLSKRLFRSILLVSSIGAFAVSVSQIGQFWNYEEALVDIGEQIKRKITPEQLTSKIQESIQNSEYDDARNYLRIAKDYHFKIDYQTFQNQLTHQDKPIKRIVKNVSDFTEGFVEGKSENLAGVAGAVSADFTVIGDVRDLRKEFGKYQANEPVNELVVILSGAGIGLTALTVGSLGTAAPAKTGASTIKLAVKSQRLTARFQKQLLKLGRHVFDWPAFRRTIKQDNSIKTIRRAAKTAYKPKAIKPFKVLANRVNSIRKSSSIADTLFLLKYVENTDDLRRLEKVTLKYGAKTKGLFKLLGKGAIRATRVLKRTTELVISIVSSILSGLLSMFLFVGRKVI